MSSSLSTQALQRLPWFDDAWPQLYAFLVRGTHALLLHGAAGIGKKALALDLARAGLCESPAADGHACGQCAGCLLVAAGSHPDLRVVVPESLAEWRLTANSSDDEPTEWAAEDNDSSRGKRVAREILVEQVRVLTQFVFMATHRGGRRIVVLAPAEKLRHEAANTLLKMLEEPPANTTFVLTTDAIDDVLPTIRSRCVLFRCSAPAPNLALNWLKTWQIDQAESALAAAGGHPLTALFDAHSAAPVLEPALKTALLELLMQGSRLNGAEVASRVPKNITVEGAIGLFQRWAWDLLALRTAGRVRYHPSLQSAMLRLVASVEERRLLHWTQLLAQLRSTQDHPLSARLVVESALLAYRDCLLPS